MTRTRIHVNQHAVRRNAKTGSCDPVITIKDGKSNIYAHAATISGPSRVVYRPDKPMAGGARVWIETECEVVPILHEEV